MARRKFQIVPILNVSESARYPELGASWQPRGGVARHDAVAWGFARAADALGVDLIQECEVTGFDIKDNRVVGVETDRHGTIRANKVGCVAAGSSGVLAGLAGFELPIESHPLQHWCPSLLNRYCILLLCRIRCTVILVSQIKEI